MSNPDAGWLETARGAVGDRKNWVEWELRTLNKDEPIGELHWGQVI